MTSHDSRLLRSGAFLLALCFGALGCGGGEPEGTRPEADEPFDPEVIRGLISDTELDALSQERRVTVRTDGATPGLTVVMPLNSHEIHLVDLDGQPVHTWMTGLAPGGWCYLQDDGSILHGSRQDVDPKFRGGGIGGVIQRTGKDGEVIWRYEFANDEHCQHHDIEPLPNGNILFIAWERHSAEEAVALGRHPEGVGSKGLWSDAVFEIRPVGTDGAEVVWSWHAWDHLVQDMDAAKPDHGSPRDHPGRIDVNAALVLASESTEEERQAEKDRRDAMAALGYGGGDEEEESDDDAPEPKDWERSGDWTHTNAVDYHPELDLIVLSSPELGEVFVIDHSTTRQESKGSAGGRYGHGGDLLWRWGNPLRHGAGTPADQKLYYQHDPTWLTDAEGTRLLVYNNGGERHDGTSFSEVLELELPFDAETGFADPKGAAHGPVSPSWVYSDPDTFFSAFISGASRLGSGNTLICSGVAGRIFEVTPTGEVVWNLYSGFGGDVEPPDHAGKAPPFALYRAARYALDHPGVLALGL